MECDEKLSEGVSGFGKINSSNFSVYELMVRLHEIAVWTDTKSLDSSNPGYYSKSF